MNRATKSGFAREAQDKVHSRFNIIHIITFYYFSDLFLATTEVSLMIC